VPGALIDPSSIIGRDITYEGFGGDTVRGYLARPAQAGPPLPAMVVIHEAGGLGEHIRDVVNRLANLGYVALGVDLYTREGGPPPMDDLAALMQRLFAIPDARVLADLEAAVDLLRSRGDVTGRVGCIGFCMGGRYTLLLATSSDRLDAAVDCWGGFIDRSTPDEVSTETRPVPPLQRAEQLCCPLLAAVGAEDQNPSPALGEQLRSAAERSGKPVQVDVYAGAGHAFFADYRPTYRPEPAALLWERVVAFLAQHLGGSG
jgi:carboxymethylenebutenolidase